MNTGFKRWSFVSLLIFVSYLMFHSEGLAAKVKAKEKSEINTSNDNSSKNKDKGTNRTRTRTSKDNKRKSVQFNASGKFGVKNNLTRTDLGTGNNQSSSTSSSATNTSWHSTETNPVQVTKTNKKTNDNHYTPGVGWDRSVAIVYSKKTGGPDSAKDIVVLRTTGGKHEYELSVLDWGKAGNKEEKYIGDQIGYKAFGPSVYAYMSEFLQLNEYVLFSLRKNEMPTKNDCGELLPIDAVIDLCNSGRLDPAVGRYLKEIMDHEKKIDATQSQKSK